MHEGHRNRMLERLMRDQGGLQEHELLEILLYNAIPRKNTNALAHTLLMTFGSIENVFKAEMESLCEVEGIGPSTAAYLKTVGIFCTQLREKEDRKLTFRNSKEFSDYLVGHFDGYEKEVLEIYCLDSRGVVQACKRYTSNDSNKVSVAPERIGKFLSINQPYAVVVAHNHVGAPCKPSAADDKFTANMQIICSINNIRFNDHMVVGEDGYYSYHLTGKLQQMRVDFSVNNIIMGRMA